MEKHKNIKNSAIIEANKISGVKLWPNPIGLGWVCPSCRTKRFKKNGKSYVLLENPNPIKFGLCKGSLDTIGYKEEIIDNYKISRFISFDAKTDMYSKMSDIQQRFSDMINNSGGIAGIIREPGDVTRLIKKPLLRF